MRPKAPLPFSFHMMKNYFKFSFFIVLSFMFTMTWAACASEGDNSEIPADTSGTLSITPEQISTPAVGGVYTVDVKASKAGWTAMVQDVPWITISNSGTSSTEGQVKLTIAKNTDDQARTAQVTVKAGNVRKYIVVEQGAPMQVGAETLFFRSIGESQKVTVKAYGEWTATASDAWLTAQHTDASTLTVTATPNSDSAPREGSVTVTCGEESVKITVRQNGTDDRNIAEPPVAGYHLVWNDEFATDGSLDVKNWRHEVKGDHWVNNELQNYVNEKSPSGKRVTEVIDGKLHINCFKENGKIYSGRVYGNSGTGWKYGYVEARIKLPSGKGTWPAFWMMPVHFTGWPKDGEIDIMEEVGYHKDFVSSSLHADGHVHSKGTQVTKEVYCKGAEGEFHVYGMEWTPEYFQFYVDGQKTLYYKNPELAAGYPHPKGYDWPYDAPFYVILNLAWGGDWGGSQGVDDSKLPVSMEVDYVRVFQNPALTAPAAR